MNLARLLKPELVKLELETRTPPATDPATPRERWLWTVKEGVLSELADLLAAGGRVGSRNRLYTDLLNRERKSTTGLTGGIAMPHVRTMEAREMVMGFARSTAGVDFDCVDGQPAHLFFAIVAPPYDDALYLRVYRQMAAAFHGSDVREAFLHARDEGEVIRAMRRMGD
jgi:mannitol/fructose-specific phosphotransferase system IIA component (Ntr-type)